MKNSNLNHIDANTPLRTSFYLRTKGETYTIHHAGSNIYCWGNIKLPSIKLKTIYHLPVFILQIIKSTPDCLNWRPFYDLCPNILTGEICATKSYMFEIFYFEYKNKKFAIEVFNNKINLYTYKNFNIKLTPIEQIPTKILKLC